MENNKLKIFVNEEFREFELPDKLKYRYAVSNYGRLISFKETFADGKLLKGSSVDSYRVFRYKVKDENGKILNKHRFICKLVAQQFLEQPSEEHKYVLHLDFYRTNDAVKNLKWATKEEMLAHASKSPYVIAAKEKLIEQNKNQHSSKLTPTKVKLLKQTLLDPNRKTRIKLLAKQFGVSEMQLYRIKRGENWGHIKV